MYKESIYLEISLHNSEYLDDLRAVGENLGSLALEYGMEYLWEMDDNIIPFVISMIHRESKNEKLRNEKNPNLKIMWNVYPEFDYTLGESICIDMNEKSHTFGKVIS